MTLIAGTILLTIITVLICLLPKQENDLFFELRIGSDILRLHQVPHVDTYSWVNRGTRWDVPEWLSFVLYALAFRAGGFFGTWLLMVLLTLTAVWVVWFWLVRRIGPVWAFPLTNLMLLAISPCIQERPYAFSYPLLAVSLVLLTQSREGRPRLLLWLMPICTVWANLHQSVVVFLCVILAYSLGDTLMSAWLRGRSEPPDLLAPGWGKAITARRKLAARYGRSAWRMLGAALACAGAAMLSPYGWRLYWNVFITLRSHTLMSNVTEWNSVFALPAVQLQPFLLVALISLGALGLSPRRSLAAALALAGLFVQSLLHARNIPLFALGSMVIVAPHFESSAREIRRRLRLPSRPMNRSVLLTACVLFYTAMVTLVCVVNLRRAVGPRGYGPAGIGEAVAREPGYPANACAFVESERFPAHLRLLNNFEIGGYLMWRLPQEPVFVDGRLDVYVGRTFDDMLVLARDHGSPAWAALVKRYDFDCVITTSGRQARTFAADPQWQLVYSDPLDAHSQHCRILLRRRPQYAALIARCLRDRPVPSPIPIIALRKAAASSRTYAETPPPQGAPTRHR